MITISRKPLSTVRKNAPYQDQLNDISAGMAEMSVEQELMYTDLNEGLAQTIVETDSRLSDIETVIAEMLTADMTETEEN